MLIYANFNHYTFFKSHQKAKFVILIIYYLLRHKYFICMDFAISCNTALYKVYIKSITPKKSLKKLKNDAKKHQKSIKKI